MKKISKFLSIVLTVCMLFSMLPALSVSAAEADEWTLATTLRMGRQYLIVADDAYALTNVTHASGLNAAAVTIADGQVTSEVTDSMLWTMNLSNSPKSMDGQYSFYFVDGAGNYLRRNNGSNDQPIFCETKHQTERYVSWVLYQRADGSYTVFTQRNANNQYPFYLQVKNGEYFNCFGLHYDDMNKDTAGASIRFYEKKDDAAYEWGEGTYEWVEDNARVQAQITSTGETPVTDFAFSRPTEEVVTEPDCTTAGEKSLVAAFSAPFVTQTKGGVEIPALGHDFGEWSKTTEPTCTEPGAERRDCSRCDAFETRDVAALGHDFGSWTVTKEATADAPGEKKRECTRCGAVETKAIAQIQEIPEAIDFTNPADAEKFEILGQENAAIEEGVGLALITTKFAVEPAGKHYRTGEDMLQGEAANTPKDMVKIPVSGDWTASLTFDFSHNGQNSGSYQFFGFYASEGDDNQNMAGIRGGDGAFQNFLRSDGVLTADSSELNSTPGLASEGVFYLRIKKEGTTYTCYRGAVVEPEEPRRDAPEIAYTEMFDYENSGIDADRLLIDAYTGMSEGWKFTLKSVELEQEEPPAPPVETVAIDFTAPADAEKYEIVNKDTAEIVEGEGITLTPTADAFEPIGGGWGGGAATPSEPKDLIKIPVEGDWTATLKLDYDQNEVAFAMSSYFAFLAMEGDDYQNMAGIRGTNNVFQDYLRQDGTIAPATVAAPGWGATPTSGFTANGTYWLRLEKIADVYIASWSADGEAFEQVFSLDGTGVEADYIVIDAYKTSTFSFGGDNAWLFTLKNLDIVPDDCEHEWAEKVIDPTCTEGGYTEKTCSKCGKTIISNKVAALGHTKDPEAAVVTDPTCTERGFTTYTCPVCGEEFVDDYVAAKGHTKDPESGVVTEPTCTEGGFTTYKCIDCGTEIIDDRTDALGHDWEDGEVITAATQTEYGKQEIICKRCGEKSTKTLLPAEYKLGPTVVADPESPTGYTAHFLYENKEATAVNFNGDISLRNDADRTDTTTYSPFDYAPGLMRGAGYGPVAMEEVAEGLWYYSVPLCCGANQYWFTLPGSSTMIADPANCPVWSPTAQQKNGYNYIYVPYDAEKQNYEVLKLREAENPRTDDKVGTWSYVPVEIDGGTQHIAVYLPYGYDAERAEPYKTIWILHGGGQDESDWMNIGSVQKIMDNLAAEGRTEPAVIVSPTTNANQLGGTGDAYANLFNVVLPFVEENYNVSKDKMDRAFGGLSMGSMNTQNIINADTEAEKFGYYGPWSGGVSVQATAKGIEYAHILFAGGSNDFGWGANAPDQVQSLADQGVFCKAMTVTGAHDFNTWCQMFRIWCEDYLWQPWAFGDGEPPVEPELTGIDFTDPADAEKYEVVNKDTAEVVEGTGVTLTPTADTFDEPYSGGWGNTPAATDPKDLIKVPVSKDWTATLQLDFNANNVSSWAAGNTYFGFMAMEGDDYQNMVGIRGTNAAFNDFQRQNGTIDTGSFSGGGFTADGTYWLRLDKTDNTYTASYSTDGEAFTELFELEDVEVDAEYIVIDAYKTASSQWGGNTSWLFTLKNLEIETRDPAPGLKPEVAAITVDGEAIEGFDPKVKYYAFAVADGAAAPVVAATAGNDETTVEVTQADSVPGAAIITARSAKGEKVYKVGFDYGPKDDYFADGDMNEGQWTILNEVKEATEEEPFKYYRFDKGMGLVMPTQHNSIYQTATPGAWSNMFTMSGGGDWEVVAKAFYPAVPQGHYQQVQFIAWQDEDNYVRMNCQDAGRRIEPFYEKNGVAVNQNANAKDGAIPAAEDGSMTMYFKINKTGNTYTITYSTDAKEWTSAGVYEAALTDVKVAVFCTQDYQPGSNNYMEPVELAFEYVAVTGRGGETVKTDEQMLTWAAQNAADYIAADLPAETAEDLTLSKAPHGYTVELITEPAGIIDAAGKVTKPAQTTNVQVSVKVTEGDTTATSEAKTVKVAGEGGEPEVNREALDKAITEAEAVEKDKYTDESVAALETALAAAKAVPADADQAAVDKAAADLNAAIEGLVEKPAQTVDKTALDAAVTEAEAIDKSKYTDESVAALEAALEAAKAVQAAEDADQAAVDAAAAALQAAIDGLKEKSEPLPAGDWKVVDAIEPGETYIIVADDAFALNNTEVPGLATYGTGNTTRGATSVTIEDGKITSAVDESMLWTFTDASGSLTAYDEQPVYFIQDAAGKYLQRGSMSRGNSGLILADALHATMRYNTWSAKAYEPAEITTLAAEDEDTEFCLYVNSEREYGSDYAARIHGSEAGFDIPSPLSHRDPADPFAFMNSENTSRITFYALSEPEVDKAALDEAVTEAEAIDTSKYTDETVAALDAALEAAKAVQADEAADQAAVDAAVEALKSAIDGLKEKPAPQPAGKYVLASEFVPGGTYVIVAGDAYALNGQPGDTTLGATAVTIEGDVITSEVTADMLWTFEEAEGADAATDGNATYLITSADGQNLRRGSGSNTPPLSLGEYNVTDQRFYTWSLTAREAEDDAYTLYLNGSTGRYYAMVGAETGFNTLYASAWDPQTTGSSIKLYEPAGGGSNVTIDFSDPADNVKYEIIGETEGGAPQSEDGRTITCTVNGVEPSIGQNGSANPNLSEAQCNTPENLIEIPVADGDWTASLKFHFEPNGGSGAWAFLGFYAAEGDDYQNMVGIRGGDGAIQDFIRTDGNITADTSLASSPGFSSANDYYFRIQKIGTTYVCSRSNDAGETYEEMFSFEDTGINAEKLIIDAYSGRGTGFTFTLDSLIIEGEGGGPCEHNWVSEVVEPTCTEGGYTLQTCSKCGKTKTTDKVPALGHDWVDGEILVAPTDTEFGEQEIICSRCGEKSKKTLLPNNLEEGYTLVKDPDSPTGYTARFVYKNDSGQQVYFNGDISLHNDADRSDTATYDPQDYRPGFMRGAGFKAEMQDLGNGYWYYELPLCCGANQYWYTVGSSTTMLPDPANTPIWSPTAQQKNAYNYLYVPYDEKQDYEVLKLREAENPRTDGKIGTWSYVPIQIGGATQHIGVYLPYGYDAERADPYKLIFILHGGGQDESDWMNIGSVQKIMDNLAAEGRTEPAVIVSPTTNSNQLGSTSDAYANLFNVVLPFVLENYNVSKDKMDRAFGGLSMGSMNTQNIINANTTAEKFGYYGPWSGGVSVNAGVPGIEYAHILFGGGTDDFGWTASAPQSVENLKAQGIFCDYKTVTGNHDFNTWCQMFRIWCEEYLWNPAAFGDGEVGEVDTTALAAAIEAAKAIDKAEYTDESVAAMEAALKAAEDALAKEGVTQTEVNRAAAALNNAVDGLVKKGEVSEVDKSELDKAIKAGDLYAEDDYTPETYGALKEALDEAKAVLAKEDATQEEVDAAAAKVKDAIDKLEKKAGALDKDDLIALITEAEELDPKWFTEESAKDLADGIAAAKEALEKAETQDDIDAAEAALVEVIENLEFWLFDDVQDENKFYFDPVYWAYYADPQITNGMDATHFGPDNPCTRGHVVTFLWRAAGCPEPKSTTTPFTDLKPGAFYEKAVAWAVEEGITKGMTDTTFVPDGKCNRGQIVTFLWRFKGSEEPKSTKTPFTDLKPGAFYEKAVAWAVENNVTKGMTDTTFVPDGICTRGQVVTFLYRATGADEPATLE